MAICYYPWFILSSTDFNYSKVAYSVGFFTLFLCFELELPCWVIRDEPINSFTLQRGQHALVLLVIQISWTSTVARAARNGHSIDRCISLAAQCLNTKLPSRLRHAGFRRLFFFTQTTQQCGNENNPHCVVGQTVRIPAPVENLISILACSLAMDIPYTPTLNLSALAEY